MSQEQHEQIDYKSVRLGTGAPASLELSVLLTLGGVGLAVVGLPLLVFGGTIHFFGMILGIAGIVLFGYGLITGGYTIIKAYVQDFRTHWRRQYIKGALIGAAVGLFMSLLFIPAAPILMLTGAALGVHFTRKLAGDTAFPALPPEDSDTHKVDEQPR